MCGFIEFELDSNRREIDQVLGGNNQTDQLDRLRKFSQKLRLDEDSLSLGELDGFRKAVGEALVQVRERELKLLAAPAAETEAGHDA